MRGKYLIYKVEDAIDALDLMLPKHKVTQTDLGSRRHQLNVDTGNRTFS